MKTTFKPWQATLLLAAIAGPTACGPATDDAPELETSASVQALTTQTATSYLHNLPAGASTPSATGAQTTWASGASANHAPQAVPGELIVKFKSSGAQSLTECAQATLAQGKSFARATADGSASLDALVQRHQVKNARALVRGRAGLSTKAAKAKLARNAKGHGKQRKGAKSAPVPTDFVNVYRVEIPVGASVEAVAAAFQRDPHVEYAHPNYQVSAVYTPNDPYLASTGSWSQTESDQWPLEQVGAEAAWDSARGAGVVVAVVDSGLDLTHPDIAGNVWSNANEIPGNGVDDDGNGYVDDVSGWDTAGGDSDPTDGNGHGTHVSGTIAAQDNNGIGIVGLAPDSQIMPLKALGDNGSGTVFALAEALLYATENGADVINNSWGCSGGCPPVPVIEDAVAAAHAAGSVVVFAAGNDRKDVKGYSPQARHEPILVSASNPLDELASFSNFGFVDVAAPGAGNPNGAGVNQPERGILSLKAAQCSSACPSNLIVGQDYLRQSGTSMAAPHVSALAALILSQHPEYTPEQVRQVIRRSAVSTTGFDLELGYGRIDAAAAMAEPTPLESVITSASMVEVGGIFTITGSATGPGFANYTVEYGEGAAPTSFVTIATSASASDAGALGDWDVSAVADGEYTLRLTATTSDGRAYEDRQLVTLDRVKITSPSPMSYHGAGPLEITGTAALAGLDHFDVRITRVSDGSPVVGADITLTGGGHAHVVDGVLATWDPSGLPADHYNVVLDVTMQSGTVATEQVAVVTDQRIHDGWPVLLENAGQNVPVQEHAVLADLDGDGRDEHIVSYAYQVNVFKHDGTQLAGWPQATNPTGNPVAVVRETPAIGDVDGDGSPDIVVPGNDGMVWLWHADGTPHAGWPKDRGFARHDATLADVDGDGGLEIVLTDFLNGLDVLRADGTSLPGFPVNPGMGLSSAATVADLDNDGDAEIVAALSGTGPYRLVAYSHTGAPLAGFPVTVSSTSSHGEYPVVGDLDDDGDLEIVAATANYNPGTARVAVYHHTGQPLAGWPKAPPALTTSAPVLADLDGDGSLEVFVGMSDLANGPPRGNLHVWNNRGELMPGWPVYVPSSVNSSVTPFLTPLVLDLDADGRREVLVPRLQDYYDPSILPSPFGHPVQAFSYDGTPISALMRPTYGLLPSSDWDSSLAVGDTDGDGLLEMVWLEDSNFGTGQVLAHSWDLDAPASAAQGWTMFRGDARHSGVAEPVVPIVSLTAADKNQAKIVDGVARYRVTTGSSGMIQFVHPWQAPVQYALGTDALQSLPQGWGGPIQAAPNTEYVLRVVTTQPVEVRIDWW